MAFSHVLRGSSDCLPGFADGLDVLLGLQPQSGNAGVAWVCLIQRELVHKGGPTLIRRRWPHGPQGLQRVAHRWRVQEGRWRVAAGQALWRGHEARQGLQGRAAGHRRAQPRLQGQAAAQRTHGCCLWRAVKREDGRVLQLHGGHLQFLLPPPLSPSVLKPNLQAELHQAVDRVLPLAAAVHTKQRNGNAPCRPGAEGDLGGSDIPPQPTALRSVENSPAAELA